MAIKASRGTISPAVNSSHHSWCGSFKDSWIRREGMFWGWKCRTESLSSRNCVGTWRSASASAGTRDRWWRLMQILTGTQSAFVLTRSPTPPRSSKSFTRATSGRSGAGDEDFEGGALGVDDALQFQKHAFGPTAHS